jgi:hypothetical protein
MSTIVDLNDEKEHDEWLRSTALSRSLEYFKQMDMLGNEEDIVKVANTFFKFLKGE